jgi:translation initiation factor 3 subunit M
LFATITLLIPTSGTAYQYALAYARSFPGSSPQAQSAAICVIVSALQLPTLFDFDPVLKLDSISAARDHPLHALLQVFVGGGLAEYQAWAGANGTAISEHCTFLGWIPGLHQLTYL